MKTLVVGWCGDEIEIRGGITYLRYMRLLVGTVEKPIIEKEVAKYDSTKVLSMCATKVMMIYLTTMDGSAAIPLIHYLQILFLVSL